MSEESEGSLEGKSAIVTGGAGGIGEGTARALSAAGANVLIADVDERGALVANELGGMFVQADVSEYEGNVELVERIMAETGRLDLVHLNAGVASGVGLGEGFDPATYRRAMGVNIDGVAFGVAAALPALKKSGGAIVATASLAGLTAVPLDPIYAANKHAVVGLVRSLGPGLEADGIRINAVCPGFADTAIISSFKEALVGTGMPIIPIADVVDAVMTLFMGEMAGECWYVQAGRPAEPFEFRNVPGPRQEDRD